MFIVAVCAIIVILHFHSALNYNYARFCRWKNIRILQCVECVHSLETHDSMNSKKTPFLSFFHANFILDFV